MKEAQAALSDRKIFYIYPKNCMGKTTCTLCRSEASFYAGFRQKEYYRCRGCSAVFMAPAYYPTPEQEKKRYLEHNNDVNDPGYRSFVMPVVKEVLDKFTEEESGLDFGAGTGPVIHKLLTENGYRPETYDPFFCNDPSLLERRYDYITCCEVVEHFHDPRREFRLLRSLLRPGASLICMTWLFSDEIDFQGWSYKNDHTHVFFYHLKSMEWIRDHFGFSSLKTEGRLIRLDV